METNSDVIVSGGGSVYLLTPVTEAAKTWVAEHLPEDTLWLGPAVAVEHRYVQDVVQGMRDDGLVVTP